MRLAAPVIELGLSGSTLELRASGLLNNVLVDVDAVGFGLGRFREAERGNQQTQQNDGDSGDGTGFGQHKEDLPIIS